MTKFDVRGAIVTHPWGSDPSHLNNVPGPDPFGNGSDIPESCVVDQLGDIYVGEARGQQRLLKFNADGELLATWNPPVGGIGVDWIDLSENQCTILHTSEDNRIRTFDVCADAGEEVGLDFATGLDGPCFAVRIRPGISPVEVMVACKTKVYRLNSSGGTIRTYTRADVGEPSTSAFFAMALDPDRESFWTGAFQTGNIYKIDIETGDVDAPIPFTPTFTAAPNGPSMAGLTVFGELTAGRALPAVGGTVELLGQSQSPGDASESSALDYAAPIAAAVVAAGAVALSAAGWYARRRWLR